MFTTIACILVGIPLGFLLRSKQSIVTAVNKLTMWAIYLLLFMLGIAIGSNDTITSQLDTIGIRAVFISLCCVLGSALAVFLLDTLYLKGQLDEG
ncbi:MAG: lysine exporter LysO family protein [Desulfovibrionales bacterium]|nr:lysine exporter LysO family protein [Desulfovibrionales bacterium]